MLIISRFTPDYTEHAARLRASCERFDLPYWIEPADDTGSWLTNCAAKAAFVLRAMRSGSESVLWLDADAEIKRTVWLADFCDDGADFAVYQNPVKTAKKWMCRSGTIWFNRTPAAFALAEEWVRLCEEKPSRFDQESLWMAWLSMQERVRVHWLPITYCQLFDDRAEFQPVTDPHIVHYQASRDIRPVKP